MILVNMEARRSHDASCSADSVQILQPLKNINALLAPCETLVVRVTKSTTYYYDLHPERDVTSHHIVPNIHSEHPRCHNTAK